MTVTQIMELVGDLRQQLLAIAAKEDGLMHLESLDASEADADKFAGQQNDLIFGQPREAARGVFHYMCVEEDNLDKRDGIDALKKEIEANGTDVDRECLVYVLDKDASRPMDPRRLLI